MSLVFSIFSFNFVFKVLSLIAIYLVPSCQSPRGCRLPTGRLCHSASLLPTRPVDRNWSEDNTLLPLWMSARHFCHFCTWSAAQGWRRNRFLAWSEHSPVFLQGKYSRPWGGHRGKEEEGNITCRRLCWGTAGCCYWGWCSRTCQTQTSPRHILGSGGWEYYNKPAVQAAGADPSRCNSTPLQQNHYNLWTSYAILMSFRI